MIIMEYPLAGSSSRICFSKICVSVDYYNYYKSYQLNIKCKLLNGIDSSNHVLQPTI